MSAPNVDVESHNAGRERNQASSRPALSWSDQLQQPGVKTVTIRTNNGNNNARSQTKFPESIVVVPDRRRFKGDNRKSLDDAQAAVQLVLNYDTREASTVKPNVRHMSGLSIKSININAHAIVTSDGSDSHTVHYSARASKKISSKRTSRTTRSQVSNSLAFLPIARTAPISAPQMSTRMDQPFISLKKRCTRNRRLLLLIARQPGRLNLNPIPIWIKM